MFARKKIENKCVLEQAQKNIFYALIFITIPMPKQKII